MASMNQDSCPESFVVVQLRSDATFTIVRTEDLLYEFLEEDQKPRIGCCYLMRLNGFSVCEETEEQDECDRKAPLFYGIVRSVHDNVEAAKNMVVYLQRRQSEGERDARSNCTGVKEYRCLTPKSDESSILGEVMDDASKDVFSIDIHDFAYGQTFGDFSSETDFEEVDEN